MSEARRFPVVGGLVVEDVVGRGGFGTVYRATQSDLGRTVALKVIHPGAHADEEVIRRFQRECQTIGSLTGHPSVVTVFEAGVTADEDPYMVLEFLPGGSLQERLTSQGPMAWTEVVQVGVAVAEALDAAHGLGIIHRDVKPANVLRDRYSRFKLGDFGIAGLGSSASTTLGSTPATVAFADPQVLLGHRATEASDLYSLGATLYSLLMGVPAFSSTTDESVVPMILRVTTNDLPPLPESVAPGSLRAVIEHLMAKDPADRPASAGAVLTKLHHIQATEITAPPPIVTAPPSASSTAAPVAPPDLEQTVRPNPTLISAVPSFAPPPPPSADLAEPPPPVVEPPAPPAPPAVTVTSAPLPQDLTYVDDDPYVTVVRTPSFPRPSVEPTVEPAVEAPAEDEAEAVIASEAGQVDDTEAIAGDAALDAEPATEQDVAHVADEAEVSDEELQDATEEPAAASLEEPEPVLLDEPETDDASAAAVAEAPDTIEPEAETAIEADLADVDGADHEGTPTEDDEHDVLHTRVRPAAVIAAAAAAEASSVDQLEAAMQTVVRPGIDDGEAVVDGLLPAEPVAAYEAHETVLRPPVPPFRSLVTEPPTGDIGTLEDPAFPPPPPASPEPLGGGSGGIPPEGGRSKTKVLVAGVIALVLIAAGTAFGLTQGGGSSVTLPKTNGMSQSGAINRLVAAGVDRADIEVVEVPDGGVNAGKVVSQDPASGASYKNGDSITLKIGSKGLEIPDVTGVKESVALDALEQAGFKAKVVRSESDRAPKGEVVSQSPSSKKVRPRDTVITLTVSSGPRSRIVPKVVGASVADAIKKLEKLNLTHVETLEFSDQPAGTVLAQSIAAGKKVPQKTKVGLTVSNGPAPTTTVPRTQTTTQTTTSNNGGGGSSGGSTSGGGGGGGGTVATTQPPPVCETYTVPGGRDPVTGAITPPHEETVCY